MKRKIKSYSLKDSVIKLIEKASKKQGRTRSQVVERALEKELKNGGDYE